MQYSEQTWHMTQPKSLTSFIFCTAASFPVFCNFEIPAKQKRNSANWSNFYKSHKNKFNFFHQLHDI